MSLKERLGWIYYIIPYLLPVENKFVMISSILLGFSNYTIKLKNGEKIKLKYSQIYNIYCLLGALCFATSYSVKPGNKIEICQDMKNKFTVSLEDLSYEDNNMLELLFWGSRFGANFITNEENVKNFRDKTFKIIEENNKKIIETKNGIKFYLDSIATSNTIVETFVNNLHAINSDIDWENKVVIDVGAEFGDTPLYFASMGARVYAFEPLKTHFDGMIRNLSLNPRLSERIIPINAAIGKDEVLNFRYEDSKHSSPGASFVYNTRKGDVVVTKINGYSLETAMKKFGINHVDLLKMDCKGCEHFLTVEGLKNVDSVKIEHLSKDAYKLENLLDVLEKAGFEWILYRQNLQSRRSNRITGYVYGKKRQTVTS